MDDHPSKIPARYRRSEIVRSALRAIGIIEWREPPIGSYPYHVTIYPLDQKPIYLGTTSTLAIARWALKDAVREYHRS